MKKVVYIVAILGIGATSFWFSTRENGETGQSYRFASVTLGDVEATVSSTGNLGAVTTVRVGTQVSGIVNRIYVDFNDRVRKGQVVAKIDTTLLVSAIRDAEANVERNRAQVKYSKSEFERIDALYQKDFATRVEINKAQYDVETAAANLKSALVNLERAERNLSYATIYSPIDGVVIERNVDLGQTVAASLSAPQLFLIANNLSRLQILASVDESDIGKIKEGQTTRFTVQAYDEAMFTGVVRQVRLQSTVQENVVTYTAVIDVDNSDGRLLPGMTATVDFLIEKATDVLKVPNAALRFRPTEEMVSALRERFSSERAARSDSSGRRRRNSGGRQGSRDNGQGVDGGNSVFPGRPGGENAGRNGGFRRADAAMLWYLDESGQISAARVRTGLTDGQETEVMGRNIKAGLEVITGVVRGAGTNVSTNPFQSNQSSRRGRPGGF